MCYGRVPPDDRYGRVVYVYCMDGSVVWFVMYAMVFARQQTVWGWEVFTSGQDIVSTAKYAHYCMGTLINKNIITIRTLHIKVWVNVSHLETN